MSIKAVWLAVLRLYRKSFSQVWFLGVIAGILAITTLILNNIFHSENLTLQVTQFTITQLISLVISIYLSALMIFKIYTISNNENSSWKDIIALVNKRYLKIVSANLIVLLITSVSALLVLPGILFFILFYMTTPLVLIDNKGIAEGLKGSCGLVWGNWWRTLAALFPFMVIYLVPAVIMVYIPNTKWLITISNGLATIVIQPLICSLTLMIFKSLKEQKNTVH